MNNDIEQRFRKRKDILRDAYATSETPLSAEEKTSLTPILNALENTETRYNTPELVAEGGEKRIYRVFDQRLNRFVAMAKALKDETRCDQEQFLREGQLTANLTHPNIVPIYNMGIDSNNTAFFSMELVPGDSLGDIINKLKADESGYKDRYGLKEMLSIFNKVCDAVAYAHSRNVLHMDIKPENIRVGQFGEVFLCDWGLACVADHTEEGEPEPGELDSDILNDMTLSGTMKGTPGFMAPEQVMNHDKTPQTDIYALGAILYLILTHSLPVDGKTANEVVENTRKGNVVHPRKRKILHPVPTGLAAVAMHALEFKPLDRYADVQSLQTDINRHLTGYPTQAEHAGIFTRLGLLGLRHRKLTLWTVAFFAILALVMSVNLSIIHRGKQIAEQNFALYKQETEQTLRISKELTDLSFYTKNVRSYISANHMISVITKLLDQGNLLPEHEQGILDQKLRVHVILQEFNAAANTYVRIKKPGMSGPNTLELFQKYAAIKPNDSDLLSDADLARFLTTNYTTIQRTMAFYLYYHHLRRRGPVNTEEHIMLAGAMLGQINEIGRSRIPEMKLSKRPEGYHLDMSHTPYSRYENDLPMTSTQNILQPLNLYSLDISHTPISLVRELKGIELNELRMVGVTLFPKSQFTGLLTKMGAERVILGKGDYPNHLVNSIRASGIEVVEEEYER